MVLPRGSNTFPNMAHPLINGFAPSLQELIKAPLHAFDRCLEEAVRGANGRLPENDSDWGIQGLVHRTLRLDAPRYRDSLISQIPSLNDVPIGSVPSGSLIRLRCMVVDILNIEYYLGAYSERSSVGGKVWRCGKFSDTLRLHHHDPGTEPEIADDLLLDRLPLRCVPIPGEADWVKAFWANDDEELQRQWRQQRQQNADMSDDGDQDLAPIAQLLHDDDPALLVAAAMKPTRGSKATKRRWHDSREDEERPEGAVVSVSTGSAHMDLDHEDEEEEEEEEQEEKVRRPPAQSSSPSSSVGPSQSKQPRLGFSEEVQVAATAESKARDVGREDEQERSHFPPDLSASMPEFIVKVYPLAPGVASNGDAGGDNSARGDPPSLPSFKICDIVEFVCVFTLDPGLYGSGDAEDAAEAFLGEYSPASSVVPRLHAIAFQRLGLAYPLLPQLRLEPGHADYRRTLTSLQAEQSAPLQHVRRSLLQFIGRELRCDPTVSELLLLHLVSGVRGRQAERVVGTFPLNFCIMASAEADQSGQQRQPIMQMEPEQLARRARRWAERLFRLVRLLSGRCLMLPLTLDSLNSQRLQPVKDYGHNCLNAGVLQLAQGTHVLIDETQMKPGRLLEAGIRNLQCLSKVVSEQQLDYDFQFHQISFSIDAPVLSVSVGGKSLVPGFPLSIRVALDDVPRDRVAADDFEDETEDNLGPQPFQALLNVWRRYLLVAKQLEFSVEEQLAQAATQWFVAQRKAEIGSHRPSEEALHQVLNLARLASQSNLQTQCSRATWESALGLWGRILALRQLGRS